MRAAAPITKARFNLPRIGSALARMKRVMLYLVVLQLPMIRGFAQEAGPAAIAYGNNPAAGKYYFLRGIRMYCETYGNGTPVLMIHGNGGNLGAFAHNIPYFAGRYRVVAVDSRAQGKSVDGGDSLSFEMMADDCAALLDTMHIDSCHVKRRRTVRAPCPDRDFDVAKRIFVYLRE